MGTVVWGALDAITCELLAFAAFGILLLGIDDLLMDMAWIASSRRRWRTILKIRDAKDDPDLRLAVLVPAWDESAVIEPMLRHALARWEGEPVRLLVGVYPNDPATCCAVAAVAKVDERVEAVVLPHGIMYQVHHGPDRCHRPRRLTSAYERHGLQHHHSRANPPLRRAA